MNYNNLKTSFFEDQDADLIKKYGQFFTPIEIVNYMIRYIPKTNNLNILDPSFGLGVFSLALSKQYINQIKEIVGFEIDTNLIKYNKELFDNSSKVNIQYEDYLLSNWDNKYDFIIANPPYYKHHFIKNKQYLKEMFKEKTNFDFDITTNIYIWFLIKSINQLSKNGRLAYIIPSEFLNANYGEKIKQYLIKNNILERIIKFDFNTDVFDDAITTSCILFIDNNKTSDLIHFSNIHDIKDLNKKYDDLETFTYKAIDLDPYKKWITYFKNQIPLQNENLILFSDIAKAKRGIATGANNYFTFNKSKQKKYHISDEALIPCICKSSLLKHTQILTEEVLNNFIQDNQEVFLFNGINKKSEFDEKYIQFGEDQKVHEKYLTSKRKPWYKPEERKSADFLVGVFHRKELKFILNETNALNLTCFHGVYLNDTSLDIKKLLFLYLSCPVSYELFILEKREYGNGLSKFEPNDINKSHILNFSKISSDDLNTLHSFANKYIKNLDTSLIEKANKIFRGYIFK